MFEADRKIAEVLNDVAVEIYGTETITINGGGGNQKS